MQAGSFFRAKYGQRPGKGPKEAGPPIFLTHDDTGIHFVSRNLLLFLMVTSVIAGLSLGFLTRQAEDAWTPQHIAYLGFPGDMFQRVSQVTVTPLTTFMAIGSIGRCSVGFIRRLGLKAVLFHLVTKLLAIATSFIVAMAFYPGSPQQKLDIPPQLPQPFTSTTVADGFLDVLRNLIPDNLMASYVFVSYTEIDFDSTQREKNVTLAMAPFSIRLQGSANQLGILFFSAFFGIILSVLHEKHMSLLRLCTELGDVMLAIHKVLVWYYPVGICFMLAVQTLRLNEFVNIIHELKLYFICIAVALGIHGLFTLPLIVVVCSRKQYKHFYTCVALPLIMAFGTSSSVTTIVTTTGIAGLPHTASLAILYNLRLLGLPVEEMSLFTLTDWILDRLVTMVNILGDAVCCSVLETFCKQDLLNEQEEDRAFILSVPMTMYIASAEASLEQQPSFGKDLVELESDLGHKVP